MIRRYGFLISALSQITFLVYGFFKGAKIILKAQADLPKNTKHYKNNKHQPARVISVCVIFSYHKGEIHRYTNA